MNTLTRLLSVLVFLSGCSSVDKITEFSKEKLGLQAPTRRLPVFQVSWSKNTDPPHDTGNPPIALNSPLIHRGIVYAGDNQGVMRAYTLSNGKEIWSGQDNGAYHASPVVHGESLIYGTN